MHTLNTDTRDGYIAGLRALADALEQNPTLEAPWVGTARGMSMHVHGRSREDMSLWATVLADAVEVHEGEYYRVSGRLHGVAVDVMIRSAKIGSEVTRERTVFEVEPFLPAVSS